MWDLVRHPSGPVHLTVDDGRSARGSGEVVVHRARGAWSDRRRIDGLAVSAVERAVVDAWGRPGGLSRSDVRAAAITAVRQRLCTPRDLNYELTRTTRLPGRADLIGLVGLLADGCRSELEIWGCSHLLRGPGMPDFVRQRAVTVRGETFLLDAACEEAMLAVELDGAAWHGSQVQRERDIRRDALLATVGWQTLRFGYRRVMRSTEACRGEIVAVAAARRRQLSRDSVR
jgi:very-short-patch-repair endonuclease